jgi:hypothetical protein
LEDQCVITRKVTVAAGPFAPGHLGELTQIVPFEMAGHALAATGTTQTRIRVLPSRVVVYLLLAGCLFAERRYRQVWHKLAAGLGSLPVASPNGNALWQARARLGAAPLRWLFGLLRGPSTAITSGAVRWHGLLVCAIDGTTMTIPDSSRNLAVYSKQAGSHGGPGCPLLRLVALVTCGTRTITDAIEAAGGIDPDRGSFTIALSAARDLLTQAANVIAGTIIDLTGAIGRRVLDNLLPDRRLRVSPRIVKRAISKFQARGPTSTGAATKPPSTSTSLLRPDLDRSRPRG